MDGFGNIVIEQNDVSKLPIDMEWMYRALNTNIFVAHGPL